MQRVSLFVLAAGCPLLAVSFWLPAPWGPGMGALLVGVLPAALIGLGASEALPPVPVEQGWWKKALLLLTLALISPFVLAVYLLRGVDGWLWGLPWPTAVLVYGALFLLVWTGAVYAATFGRGGEG